MRFSREMTGLPVIHAANGRELGKVREWLLDERGEKIVALLAEGGGWLPHRCVFLYRDLLKIGRDAIFVSREGLHAAGDPPELNGHATCRALGKRMLSGDGDELGVVEDVLFEEKTGQITGWRLSSGLIDDVLYGRPVIAPAPNLHIGEDVMILRD